MSRIGAISAIVLAMVLLVSPCVLAAVPQEDVKFPTIVPPKFEKGTVVKLPAEVDDVQVGGDGRYIFYQFRSLNKIGMFDVNEAKLVHYFPTPDIETRFAAGLNKMVMINGEGTIISRWDLESKKRELTQTIDLDGSPSSVLLGSASNGPMVVYTRKDGSSPSSKVVDLQNFAVTEAIIKGRGGFRENQYRISSNGKTIGGWATSGSPSGLNSYQKVGDQWQTYYEHDSVGQVFPSADGKFLLTSQGVFTAELRKLDAKSNRGSVFAVPAVHGPFCLNLPGELMSSSSSFRSRINKARNSSSKDKESNKETDKNLAALQMIGDNRTLASVGGLDSVLEREDQWGRSKLSLEKRIVFAPKANLIVVLDSKKGQLGLLEFDIAKALKESEIEYLLVTSRPPLQVVAGQTLEYQIDTLSKTSEVKYSLDSSPAGMKISKDGKLAWATTERSSPENDVIISVSDKSGQQIFHNFHLKVAGGKGKAIAKSGGVKFSRDVQTTKVSATDVGGESKTIPLPGTVKDIVVGANGRLIMLYFNDLRKIGIFDVSQAKIVKYLPVDDQTLMAAGANHLVAISQSDGIVARYNLTTFERELTKTNPFAGPVLQIVMGSNSFGPVLTRWAIGTGSIDRCNFDLLDLENLDVSDIQWTGKHKPHSVFRDQNSLRASNDGETFSVGGIGPMFLNGKKLQFEFNNNRHRGIVLPSASGKYFIAGDQVIKREGSVDRSRANNPRSFSIPSVTGDYYISFSGSPSSSSSYSGGRGGRSQNTPAKLFMFGDARPLLSISGLETPTTVNYQNRQGLLFDKRCLFIPEAKVIVSVANSNDQLVVRPYDVSNALEQSGVDYLFVSSVAPGFAKFSEPYEYQIAVKSKKGGLKFQLEAAPENMKISSEGKITWRPSKDLKEARQEVIVTVKDSAGQEVFHTFGVEVPELVELKAAMRKADQEKKRREDAEAKQKEAQLLVEKKEIVSRERRKQALLRLREQSNKPTPGPSPKTIEFEIRDWLDSTGKHKINAKFEKVVDQSTVLLRMKDGTMKRVPLSRLSSEDIYEAVKNDLLLKGQSSQKAEDDSPFEDLSQVEEPALSPTEMGALITRIGEMIEVAQSGDGKTVIDSIFEPKMVARLKTQSQYKEACERVENGQNLEIVVALMDIDFGKFKVLDNKSKVHFLGLRLGYFIKINNTWYLSDSRN